MPRTPPTRKNHVRAQLAQLAAKLIAVDGVSDFALAKKKAARQAGVSDLQTLPSNEEVEQALREYQAIFQGEGPQRRLLDARMKALALMRLLEPFNPYLTGPVLTGTAGPRPDVHLQLFTDRQKEVELFLLNQNIAYQSGERRYRFGDGPRAVPTLSLWLDGNVEIALFAADALRALCRDSNGGEAGERVKAEQLAALIEATRAAPAGGGCGGAAG